MQLTNIRHSTQKKTWLHFFYFITGIVSVTLSSTTQAVPAFARQTGQECASCHIGGFGPQLTDFGRNFKLGGYTLKSGKESTVPLSAMLVGIYDQTSKDLPSDAATPHFSTNNNTALQEASIFGAGKIAEHMGGFVQVTYSGIERKTSLDNLDLRYARPITLADESAIVGVSINNNPTVQDTWNTIPAWRFPYMAADLAPGAGGSPLIAGGLEQQVIGVTTYVSWNDAWYGEAGLYRSQPTSWLKSTNEIESADEESQISGVAPYWRVAYRNSANHQNYSVGFFGLNAKVQPGAVAGLSDKFNDMGIDASYQFMGTGRHIFTMNASYIHENQTLNATVSSGGADNTKNTANSFNINGSYFYQNTYGVTLAYFNNNGSKQDNTLYSENPFDGSRTGHPDSNGYVIQADYTPFGKEESWQAPFANVRLGLQYTLYNTFNGASKNYDGAGRNASDNNTLMFMIWTAI